MDDFVPLSVDDARQAHKRHVWDFFELSLAGEVDATVTKFFWHWLLFPAVDLIGPELVYSIGLESLGYPPTWCDTQQEADQVEAAITKFLEKE